MSGLISLQALSTWLPDSDITEADRLSQCRWTAGVSSGIRVEGTERVMMTSPELHCSCVQCTPTHTILSFSP